MNIRTFDHLVLPVEHLTEARVKLQRLGFSVAPDARHPFGTENACIFLQDGSYLEPLGIADHEAYASSADAGNVFTSRDRQARAASSGCGFSALVLASEDALADEARYRACGISAGAMLEFSRKLTVPDAGETTASFRLAFAAHEGSESFFVFSCQRINALPRDMGDLVKHANGVTGLREVVLSTDHLERDCHFLETALSVGSTREAEGIVFTARTARIRLLARTGSLAEGFNDARAAAGLQGRSVVFVVADLAVTAATLAANDVPFLHRERRLTVAAATGQDVEFAFEE